LKRIFPVLLDYFLYAWIYQQQPPCFLTFYPYLLTGFNPVPVLPVLPRLSGAGDLSDPSLSS